MGVGGWVGGCGGGRTHFTWVRPWWRLQTTAPPSATHHTSDAGKSPYDPGNGPVFLAAKLNVLTDMGEGITVPSTAPQAGYMAGCCHLLTDCWHSARCVLLH